MAAALPAGGAQPSYEPLVWLWLGGVCLCALFFAVSYIRCRREFKTALPVKIIPKQLNEIAEQNERLRQMLEAAETDGGTHDAAAPVPPDSPDARLLSEKDWVWPCPESTTVTSRYGMRRHPIGNEYIFKDHIDIGADEGAAVVASLDGTVSETGFHNEHGNYIIIDHGDDVRTVYRHLRETLVRAGDTVAAGEMIGTVGSTGVATGPFLAFCVYIDAASVNPLIYFDMKI